MQSNADDYRARARECESAAQRATTAGAREQLLELARGWRAMADHVEQRSRLAAFARADGAGAKTGP